MTTLENAGCRFDIGRGFGRLIKDTKGTVSKQWRFKRQLHDWRRGDRVAFILWRKTIAGELERTRRTANPGPRDIVEAFHRARWMLELKDDWDERGSPGYSRETWNLVRDFLSTLNITALRICGKVLPVPEILPGPKGSLDVLWRSTRSELLLNFPSNKESLPTFYGDASGESCIRGNLDSSKAIAAVTAWLVG